MNACVVAVFPVKTEPKPGVSTKHIPEDNKGLGTKTSAPSTAFVFSGFSSSVTYSFQVDHGNVPPGPVSHANARMNFVAKPNHGRHRRDRNKPGRNNFVADKSVSRVDLPRLN